MTKEELREKFLAQFDKGLKDRLTPKVLEVIDENVESFLKGNMKIDGRVPEKEEEIIEQLNIGFLTRIQIHNGMEESFKQLSKENPNVNINYRGKALKP